MRFVGADFGRVLDSLGMQTVNSIFFLTFHYDWNPQIIVTQIAVNTTQHPLLAC